MSIPKLTFDGVRKFTYEEVVSDWKNKKFEEPFSGHFLIRLTSELNLIEGIDMSYNRTREIFESESVQNYTGDIRDLYSVMNNKEVAKFLNSKYSERAKIDIPLIKEVHRLLMFGSIDYHRYHDNGERAGEFKKKEYAVGRYDVGAASKDVLRLMVEVCSLCDNAHTDPLKYATAFHCYFQNIHPFADGNGRVGRWLTNYLLVLNDHAPLLFDSSRRESYYKCLELFDRDEDFNPLYDWLKEGVISSYSSWK